VASLEATTPNFNVVEVKENHVLFVLPSAATSALANLLIKQHSLNHHHRYLSATTMKQLKAHTA
jgi:hypothetical protein